MSQLPKTDSDDVWLEAYNERLRLLLHQSYPAAYISVLVALLLVAALWQPPFEQTLLVWYSAIVVTALLRLAVFTSFRRKPPFERPVSRREILYRATTLSYFSVWGLGGLWVMQDMPLIEKLIIFYFLMGLAGSAISVFSANRFIQLGAILILLAPVTLWLFAQGGLRWSGMAIAGGLFLLSAIRSSKILSDAIQMNSVLKHSLFKANKKAEYLARVDELTQVYNRRAFDEYFELQRAQAQRLGCPLSLILMDIDHFKRINDKYGHSEGDAALIHAASLLSRATRSSDIFGRIGGEEFALLLPNTTLAQAKQVAENLRELLAATDFAFPDGSSSITASFGVIEVNSEMSDVMRSADGALYRAKATGRNRVIAATAKGSEY
ncbi:MAG: GGDEF domain-containing protein [Halioglobus sp.]|nr:GGDEF domain-containing protein [Halioglobus sp.]